MRRRINSYHMFIILTGNGLIVLCISVLILTFADNNETDIC